MNIQNIGNANILSSDSVKKQNENQIRQHETVDVGDKKVVEERHVETESPLHRLPEIRDEVVAQAIAKLNSGYYQTREAAVDTAKSILA